MSSILDVPPSASDVVVNRVLLISIASALIKKGVLVADDITSDFRTKMYKAKDDHDEVELQNAFQRLLDVLLKL